MAIRYNKLWKLLIDKDMMKKDLRIKSGITTNALAKLGKNEHISTQVLEKICKTLNCNIEDVCEFVNDEDKKIEHTLKNLEGKDYLQYEWLDLDKIEEYPLLPQIAKQVLKEKDLPVHRTNNDLK